MATMIDIKEFLKFIMPDVPKAPQNTVLVALHDTVRDFCQRTKLWTSMSDWTDMLSGQSTYGFNMPDGTQQCGIMHVDYRQDTTVDPYSIRPISADELDMRRPNWRTQTALSPQFFIAREPSLIQFVPYLGAEFPDQPQVFRVEVALFPTVDCLTVPRFLFDSWGIVISAGAKVRLLSMPKQPWSGDPTFFLRQYDVGLGQCRTKVNKSGTRQSAHMNIPLQGRR